MSPLFLLLGTVFGSFGSVLITRLCEGKSIGGRSACPHCKKTLSPLELVPLASFFVQGGKCKGCGASIGMLYPATELASGILFVAAWFHEPAIIPALLLALCFWLLLVIAIIDIRTHTIFDALNGLLFAIALSYGLSTGRLDALGILLGGGFFGFLWLLGRGKWVGSGDILLGLSFGALAGSWQHAAVGLMITYIFGGAVAAALLLAGKIHRKQYVAFAPFLAVGTVATVLLEGRIGMLLEVYF